MPVVVDAPQNHSQTGHLYTVSVDISIPGREIVVDRQGAHPHVDARAAVRDAFAAAERRIRKAERRPRAGTEARPAQAPPGKGEPSRARIAAATSRPVSSGA